MSPPKETCLQTCLLKMYSFINPKIYQETCLETCLLTDMSIEIPVCLKIPPQEIA